MELIITISIVTMLLLIWVYEEQKRKLYDIIHSRKLGHQALFQSYFKKYVEECQKNDRQRDKISELNRKIRGLEKKLSNK